MLSILALAYPSGQTANAFPILVTPSLSFSRPLLPLDTRIIRPRVYGSPLIDLLHLLNVFTWKFAYFFLDVPFYDVWQRNFICRNWRNKEKIFLGNVGNVSEVSGCFITSSKFSLKKDVPNWTKKWLSHFYICNPKINWALGVLVIVFSCICELYFCEGMFFFCHFQTQTWNCYNFIMLEE